MIHCRHEPQGWQQATAALIRGREVTRSEHRYEAGGVPPSADVEEVGSTLDGTRGSRRGPPLIGSRKANGRRTVSSISANQSSLLRISIITSSFLPCPVVRKTPPTLWLIHNSRWASASRISLLQENTNIWSFPAMGIQTSSGLPIGTPFMPRLPMNDAGTRSSFSARPIPPPVSSSRNSLTQLALALLAQAEPSDRSPLRWTRLIHLPPYGV